MPELPLIANERAERPDDEPMLQWFDGTVSRLFAELAQRLTDTLPRSAERTVALRKLLEANDAAVRCARAEMRENTGQSSAPPGTLPNDACPIVAVLEGERFRCSVQGPHDDHDFTTIAERTPSIRVCPRAGCQLMPGHDGTHEFSA